MGLIKDQIEIIGVYKSKTLVALFDSGAYMSYIKKGFFDGEKADDIGFHVFEGIHRAILANGKITDGVRVRFKSLKVKNKVIAEPQIVVMDDLIEDAIIGALHMQELRLKLDLPNEIIESNR